MLHGRRVLIVEDESLIAMELSDIVEGSAGRVVGPFRTNRDALAALEPDRLGNRPIDAAILDLNLADGEATPIAEKLREAGVPILICTAGTLPRAMRPMKPGLMIHNKPIRPSRLVADLSALCGAA